MKKTILPTLLAAAALAVSCQPQQQAVPQKLLFLAIGQSNMVGKGEVAPEDLEVSPRFLNLASTRTDDREIGDWRVARPGNCRPGYDYPNYVSLTDHFGLTLLDYLPATDTVGVLQVGVDGCAMRLFDKDQYVGYVDSCNMDWMNGQLDAYDRNPYGRLVTLARQAQEQGWTISGLLVHQGETDAYSDAWYHTLNNVYGQLLIDLNLLDADVPLLVGEVAGIDLHGICAHANPTIDHVSDFIPTAYTISAYGCPVSEDFVHFSAEGYHKLGLRYAQCWLRHKGYEVSDFDDAPLQCQSETVEGDDFHVETFVRQQDHRLMIASVVPLSRVDVVSFSGATLGVIELNGAQTTEVDLANYPGEDRLMLNIHSLQDAVVNRQVNLQ